MKSDVDKAISQVGVIHDAIERSQSRWEGLSRMLIAYGGLGIFLNVSDFYIGYFPSSGVFLIPIIVSKGILYAGLFVYFALLYRREKGAADKYYLGCLDLLGFIIFAFPLSTFLINVTIEMKQQNMEVHAQRMMLMGDQEQIANILLFCLCVVVCGLICERRGVTIGSVLLLLVYLALSVPFRSAGISFSLVAPRVGTMTYPYYGIYYILITTVGYIIIGILLRRPGRRSDGDQ